MSPQEAAIWARAEAIQRMRAGGQNPQAEEDALDQEEAQLFGPGEFDEHGNPIRRPYHGWNPRNLRGEGDSQPPLVNDLSQETADPNPGAHDAGDEGDTMGLWTKVEGGEFANMKPCRAIRLLVPADVWRRDATHFKDWQMPASKNSDNSESLGPGSARVMATAALVSGVFAGTAMGIPCGKHAELQRQEMQAQQAQNAAQVGAGGRSAKPPSLDEVDRYVYIPGDNTDDEWPMFHIGYEEIAGCDETNPEVTFIGVWLFTYDPMHSTSYLMSKMMRYNALLFKSTSAGRQAPDMRQKQYATEATTRKKSGFSSKDLNDNFERTVGMQFGRIKDMESYKSILSQHAGVSIANKTGAMFVRDIDRHTRCPSGRRVLSGDKEHGFGSFHPLAVEFCCNAKRPLGLSFGATKLDGSPGDIHPRHLDPNTYFQDAGDHFSCPEGIDLWICTSPDRRTIFELPLPRPLQNQVVPGEALMRLYKEMKAAEDLKNMPPPPPREEVETAADVASALDLPVNDASLEEARAMHQQGADDPVSDGDAVMADAAGPIEVEDEDGAEPVEEDPEPELPPITKKDYQGFRSLITETDEMQRVADENIRGMLRDYASMEEGLAASVSSSSTMFAGGSKENSYRIEIKKMNDLIAEESTRAWSKIINPWVVKWQQDLENRRSQLEQDGVPSYDEHWTKIDKEEAENQTRFEAVKKDLTVYHLQCLLSSFHSARDRDTIPEGFNKMVTCLEKEIEGNGGTASMAFRTARKGMQITGSDHGVFHELQEWLGHLFTHDALIEGRDRFIMDELYLQSFDMYSETTFVLIVCSERGKGKSLRATRLMKMLPPKTTKWNAASSARAGMNGTLAAARR